MVGVVVIATVVSIVMAFVETMRAAVRKVASIILRNTRSVHSALPGLSNAIRRHRLAVGCILIALLAIGLLGTASIVMVAIIGLAFALYKDRKDRAGLRRRSRENLKREFEWEWATWEPEDAGQHEREARERATDGERMRQRRQEENARRQEQARGQQYAPHRPSPQPEWWREVLDVPSDCSLRQAEEAYRQMAMKCHPDRGGSHEAMSRLNDAIKAARATLA
jgi:hypothetical protein